MTETIFDKHNFQAGDAELVIIGDYLDERIRRCAFFSI